MTCSASRSRLRSAFFLVLSAGFLLPAFLFPPEHAHAQTFTDVEGNEYTWVRIGGQVWMSMDLRTTLYKDGSPISAVSDSAEWSRAKTGAWVAYDNDPANVAIYGRLYNGIAMGDARGICPSGWHVPNNDEWDAMIQSLGGREVAGGKLKATGNERDGTGLWLYPNWQATNESGFTGLPGGGRNAVGVFDGEGFDAFYWSSTLYDIYDPWAYYLTKDNADTRRYFVDDRAGLSIRCMRYQEPATLGKPLLVSAGPTLARVRSEWVHLAGGDPREMGAVWSTDGVPALESNEGRESISPTAEAAFVVPMTALSPDTEYQVRVYAINAEGVSYSEPTRIRTTSVGGTVTDIDGNVYPTIQVGNQIWMAENLRVSRFQTGEAIPEASDSASWDPGSSTSAGPVAWAHYQNDPSHGAVYGKLYKWAVAGGDKEICPVGWRVPSDQDWTALTDGLGGVETAGGPMKAPGTLEDGTGFWLAPNAGADAAGLFRALPGGYRSSTGEFANLGRSAFFWSSSATGTGFPYYRLLISDNPSVTRFFVTPHAGYSIRCVKTLEPLDVAALRLSVADVAAGTDGIGVAEVFLTGFTAANQVVSFAFDMPLPDGVSVDSIGTSGTLTDGQGAQIAGDVTSVDGRSVLGVAYAGGGDLAPGDSPLLRLHLRVEPFVSDTLRPEQVLVNQTEVADVVPGALNRTSFGDVDGDGAVRAYDGAVVLNYLVGRNLLIDLDPFPWVQARLDAADVDGNGQVQAMDASWILQYLVELITAWPADGPAKSVAAKSVAAPAVGVRSGDGVLAFAVDGDGLTAFQVELPLRDGVAYGEPVSSWDGALMVFAEDAEDGVLRIAFAATRPAQGEFLRVPYTLDPGALDGASSLELDIAAVANTEERTLRVELVASGTGVWTEPGGGAADGGEGADGGGQALPERFELRAVYPNPFNPATQLRFALPQASEVRLEVFDAAGRRVAVLAEGMRPAGMHVVSFEAGSLSSGVYLARFTAPGFVQTRTMVLLK